MSSSITISLYRRETALRLMLLIIQIALSVLGVLSCLHAKYRAAANADDVFNTNIDRVGLHNAIMCDNHLVWFCCGVTTGNWKKGIAPLPRA